MYSKIKITGEIEIITGLHIGSGGEFSAIGAIDSPVVRDLATNLPIVPGSSIKGKMRSLLARKYCGLVTDFSNESDGLKRMFGDSESKTTARLQISDSFIIDEKQDFPFSETKFENTINRLNAVANPRQIERVTKGSRFNLHIIYNVDNENEVIEDFEIIKDGLNLLENDYLGGGGSRGSGRIEFSNIKYECVCGDYDISKLPSIK